MKVLVVGAGVAGLSVALFLSEKAVEVKLIDKTAKPTHLGYTIILWPNSTHLLKKLNIYAEVRSQAKLIDHYRLLDQKGRYLFKIDFSKFNNHQEAEALTVERAVLHDSLVQRFGTEKIGWQTEIVDINETEDFVEVTYQTGTKEKFDFIVGADGIYSSLRNHYFADDEVQSYHSYTYIFWLDTKRFKIPETIVEYGGKHSSLMLLPTKDKCTVYVISVADVSHEFIDNDLFEQEFADYDPTAFAIVKSMRSVEHVYKTPVRHIETTEVYRGRVILIGDAVHATTPITGMGSTVAMQDAYVLADELTKDYGNYREALQNYQKRRESVMQHAKKVSNTAMDLAIKSKASPFLKYSHLFMPFARPFIERMFHKYLANFINDEL